MENDSKQPKDEDKMVDINLSDLNVAKSKDKKPETQDESFDALLDMVGSSGKWIWMIRTLTAVTSLVGSISGLAYGFLGATPDYWCQMPALEEANWTQHQIQQFAIPRKKDGSLDGCHFYARDYEAAAKMGFDEASNDATFVGNDTIACTARTFNTSQYEWTTVIRWDLVCERRYIYSSTQSIIYVGIMTGALITGYLSDRFGRRPVFLAWAIVYSIVEVLVAVVPTVDLFIAVRWLCATTGHGLYIVCYVIMIELAQSSHRARNNALFSAPIAIGHMLMPVIAYFVRTYQRLQLVLTLPVLLFTAHFFLLPESPRWLVMQGRFKEATAILQRAANMNGKILPDEAELHRRMALIYNKESKDENPSGKSFKESARLIFNQLTSIFRNKMLRKYTIVLFFCWMAVSMVYYGISLNGNNLTGNVYLYMILSGFVEIPGSLLNWPALNYFGRRWTYFGVYFICGTSLLFILAVPEEMSVPQLILSLLGKICITAAFDVAYIYVAEIIPTNKRTYVLGMCSCFARIGSVTSPYITDLLGEKNSLIPVAVFGVVSILAAGLTLLLPETKKLKLPDSISDAANVNVAFQRDDKN